MYAPFSLVSVTWDNLFWANVRRKNVDAEEKKRGELAEARASGERCALMGQRAHTSDNCCLRRNIAG